MSLENELFAKAAKVLTVSELTRSIRALLETRLGSVWVQGEISNYKQYASGHQYFTLKDARAQIACVIFRNTLPPAREPLADGAQVQIYGELSVFEARGQYQLSVQIVQTRGLGLLQAKFEALKRKLEAEGLFDPARKRALPRFPRRLGIVTSPNGAAIRDMLNVLRRRAPWVEVLINPVRVQGAGAAAEIATAIHELSVPSPAWPPVDLIVLARGGGSIEDLWEFNEEIVARAIVACALPVVSAVGHEIDFTISDFAADLRAPTPSAAAELIVPDAVDLTRRTSDLSACLQRISRAFIADAKTRLRFLSERTLQREPLQRLRDAQQQIDAAREALERRLAERAAAGHARVANCLTALRSHNPARELQVRGQQLSQLQARLGAVPPRTLASAREQLNRLSGLARVLGPEATLLRGYSITMDAGGKVITSASTAIPGAAIVTQVADGKIASVVKPPTRSRKPKTSGTAEQRP